MSSSLTSAGGQPQKRLSTHHRVRKVPPEFRKRSTRACDACNVRRVKCSGSQPCSRCLASSRTCEYAPNVSNLAVMKESYEQLQKRCTVLQQCLHEALPSQSARDVLLAKWTHSTSSAASAALHCNSSSENVSVQGNDDGRILQDIDGYARYLGESSGAAFMDRLREFVSTVIPLLSDANGVPYESIQARFTSLLGQYHSHDSRPLVLPTVDPFFLPDADQMFRMVAIFRFYAADGGDPSDNGGIYYWGDLSNLVEQGQNIRNMDSGDDSISLCILNAVMALTCQYDPSFALPWETHPGETYFSRAKLLLMNPLEEASLARMRALCLMGHYMLGLYRRDAAYMYIGLAVRIGIAHGLHKGRIINIGGSVGEQIKREFWNAFILDRWLSCLLGRPVAVTTDAITVALPQDSVGLPISEGLREHVKLSIVIDEIINVVYGLSGKGVDHNHNLERIEDLLQRLSTWHSELPQVLQLREGRVPDRGTLLLHMIYNQAIILTTRPSLFLAVKQAVASKYIAASTTPSAGVNISHMKQCVLAARAIACAMRQLLSSDQSTVQASLEYHFTYSAAIVLTLANLSSEITASDDAQTIDYLIQILQQLGYKGNESARDCATIVSELDAVVKSLISHGRMRRSRLAIADRNADGIGFVSPTVEAVSTEPQMSVHEEPMFGVNSMLEFETPLYEEMFSWFTESA